MRRDNTADAEGAEDGENEHPPEIGDVGEWPDTKTAQQCRQQNRRPASVAISDPAHQKDAEQDAKSNLQRLENRILEDCDDVARAPDEGIKAGGDAVSVENNKTPGDLHQNRELPLHAGQWQSVDARRDMAADYIRWRRLRCCDVCDVRLCHSPPPFWRCGTRPDTVSRGRFQAAKRFPVPSI